MEVCFLKYLKDNQPVVYEELMKEKTCTDSVYFCHSIIKIDFCIE